MSKNKVKEYAEQMVKSAAETMSVKKKVAKTTCNMSTIAKNQKALEERIIRLERIIDTEKEWDPEFNEFFVIPKEWDPRYNARKNNPALFTKRWWKNLFNIGK